MITVVSDTHGTDGHRLHGRTLDAVRDADVVVHAGDFTTAAVLDAFEAESERLVGVVGNRDDAGVRARLDDTAIVDADGMRLVVTHGHEHGKTDLSLLARQERADLVVVGHSHRPGVERLRSATLLNPGSHADPRRYTAAHAELMPTDAGVRGRLVTPGGEQLQPFEV